MYLEWSSSFFKWTLKRTKNRFLFFKHASCINQEEVN